jgi:hypothetical protein
MNTANDPVSVLLWALAVLAVSVVDGLWTAAWIHWFFAGSLRQTVFWLAPEKWRNGTARDELMAFLPSDVDTFLAVNDKAPPLLTGVLMCPGCFSAHASVSGVLVCGLAFGLGWYLIPAWAAGAWIGRKFYERKKR